MKNNAMSAGSTIRRDHTLSTLSLSIGLAVALAGMSVFAAGCGSKSEDAAAGGASAVPAAAGSAPTAPNADGKYTPQAAPAGQAAPPPQVVSPEATKMGG